MKKKEIMTIRAIFERSDAPLPCGTAVKIAQFFRQTDAIIGEFLAAAMGENFDGDYEKAQKELSELYEEDVPDISLTLSQEELSGVDLTVRDAYELLEAGVFEEEE